MESADEYKFFQERAEPFCDNNQPLKMHYFNIHFIMCDARQRTARETRQKLLNVIKMCFYTLRNLISAYLLFLSCATKRSFVHFVSSWIILSLACLGQFLIVFGLFSCYNRNAIKLHLLTAKKTTTKRILFWCLLYYFAIMHEVNLM